MKDLIDRQAAIDALEKVAGFFQYRKPGNRDSYLPYNEAWNDAIGRAEIEIESMPSAQPERATGKWLKKYNGQVNSHCSVCGNEVGRETNFCPKCGAEMRGE